MIDIAVWYSLRIALAQISSRLGNVEANLEKHLEYIEKAKRDRADLIVFPELSLTGYLLKDLAYELSEKCKKAVEKIVERSEGMWVVLGVVEEERMGIYRNSAAVIGDGKLLGLVPKSYLPCYGLFEEKRYFKEGEAKDIKTFETRSAKIGTLICEDIWHPEPCEAIARMGADIALCIAASPIRGFYGSEGKKTHIERSWEVLLGARAIENTVFMVFVNKAGAEDEEFFWGGSMIMNPDGSECCRAATLKEDYIVGEIDLNLLKRVRRFSSFRDHRQDIHTLLERL